MDLLAAIENDVLQQKEEETLNVFSSVADLRDFITNAQPRADVSVTIEMCCLHAERLNSGHGTRVTLVDAAQRTMFEPTANALADLTLLKRKPYLAQVTVWDAKPKKGTYGKPNIDFQPGAVYKFRYVDGVGFYADIAKGNVQYDRENKHKILESESPFKKRKVQHETPPKSSKTKAQTGKPTSAIQPMDDDVAMDSEEKQEDAHKTITTRSKRGDLLHP